MDALDTVNDRFGRGGPAGGERRGPPSLAHEPEREDPELHHRVGGVADRAVIRLPEPLRSRRSRGAASSDRGAIYR